MTTHELAELLLKEPDRPIIFFTAEDHPDNIVGAYDISHISNGELLQAPDGIEIGGVLTIVLMPK
jgi:hypothetical protein